MKWNEIVKNQRCLKKNMQHHKLTWKHGVAQHNQRPKYQQNLDPKKHCDWKRLSVLLLLLVRHVRGVRGVTFDCNLASRRDDNSIPLRSHGRLQILQRSLVDTVVAQVKFLVVQLCASAHLGRRFVHVVIDANLPCVIWLILKFILFYLLLLYYTILHNYYIDM